MTGGEPREPEVSWWWGRTVGVLLSLVVAAVGWTVSWAAALELGTTPQAAVSRWAEPQTLLTRTTTTPTVRADRGVRTGRADALRGPQPADAAPTSEPSDHQLQADALKRQREARIRRALRSDRELAAFLETTEAVAPTWAHPIGVPYRVSATFGASGSMWAADHTGVDLAVATGTPVGAVAGGTVTAAEEAGAYGLKVEVTHPDGTETWYCHLSRIDVVVGQPVDAGTVLGAVGATGNVTGPHLHLELRTADGVPLDPVEALAAGGVLI